MIRALFARGKEAGVAPVLLACLSLVMFQVVSTRSALAEDSGCSGFACLFSRDDAPKTSTPPAAADSAARSANAQALKEGQADTDAQEGGPSKLKAATSKADASKADASKSASFKSAPVRPIVTIAAEPSEVDRLKRLAVAMPREKVRIVRSGEPADLILTRTLGNAGHGGTRLFTEALHIVAGPAIRTMQDLDGKVVAFAGLRDAEGAARQAFEAAHVSVKATPLDLANALDGLATGDLDAVVVLAPPPMAQLASLRTSGLHLVSWPDGIALPLGADATSIDADRYPNLVKPGESVRAVAVDAVLDLNEKGAKAQAARTFLATLSQHAAALARQGFELRKADLERPAGARVASAAGR